MRSRSFAARRSSRPRSSRHGATKVMAQIGDAVAIVLGATEPPGEVPFRQNSQAFYLSGVVEPRAIVLIDGRTKQTTVFLQPADARRDTSMFGPALAPGAEAAKALGVDAVLPRAEFTAAVTALASDRRTIYTPFAAEVLGSQSQGDPTRMWTANKADPWDGRDSREAAFIDKLKLAVAIFGDQESRSDRQRAARGEEPARDCHSARSDAGSPATASSPRCGVPARACTSTSCRRRPNTCSRRRERWAPRTSRWSRPAGTPITRTITAAPRRWPTATWCSSTTRRTTSTTSPT